MPTPNATLNDFSQKMLFVPKSYVYWLCKTSTYSVKLLTLVVFPSADQETCFDVEKERCENFEFYCGTRSQFMSNYCKLTCKMCVPGQTPPLPCMNDVLDTRKLLHLLQF